jgi:hypothetical protein
VIKKILAGKHSTSTTVVGERRERGEEVAAGKEGKEEERVRCYVVAERSPRKDW